MKLGKCFFLFSLFVIVIFLRFWYSKEAIQRRQIDTYNRRIKEYFELDSINKASLHEKEVELQQ
jgi:regulatory protein YycI of two-component signal transduction system YycFG